MDENTEKTKEQENDSETEEETCMAESQEKHLGESILTQLCESCQDVRTRLLENFRDIEIDKIFEFAGISDDDEDEPADTTNELSTNDGEAKDDEVEKDVEVEGKSLLSSLHRRTLTEIDWEEISLFAKQNLLDKEDLEKVSRITRVLREGKDELQVAFKAMESLDMQTVAEQTEKCIRCMIHTGRRGWELLAHWELPDWLKDNDFLRHGHRPPLPSFRKCFGSMFRVHTETGNIWTHLIGLVLFVIAMLFTFLRPVDGNFNFPVGWEEYIVFGAFFMGAILCLLFSWLFHTCYCHSVKVHSLFSKLDYSGIACLIMGSFVPCLYYGFYCRKITQLVYLIIICVLGVTGIVISLWDKFGTPKYRPVRAGVFLALGCSGVIPSIHMVITHGFLRGVQQGALAWLVLMGLLYISGAVLYALRIPERYFPRKCNFWFQSHQIFHVLVVMAAFVHLHGVCQMAYYRNEIGKTCSA